jgi:hypothetical protein
MPIPALVARQVWRAARMPFPRRCRSQSAGLPAAPPRCGRLAAARSLKLHDATGSYGLSIIAIVAIVKAVTYPLNYKVYASQFEMQAIQPEIDRIKEEYADNPEIINMRTSVLFQEKEVNPLAGCLPILIQFPVFIGLYRTLLNLGRDRVLEEPFLFIPSLMGPVVAGHTFSKSTLHRDILY